MIALKKSGGFAFCKPVKPTKVESLPTFRLVAYANGKFITESDLPRVRVYARKGASVKLVSVS